MMISSIILLLVLIDNCYSGKILMIILDEGDDQYPIELIQGVSENVTINSVIAPKLISNDDLDNLCAMGRPDLLLDFTKSGIPSETIKKYARHMYIPTISTSYGDAGDIVEWRSLTPMQKQFLVQIKRPEDIVPDMIRYIVINNKYKDAGILYDDSFYMMNKLKMLLINLKVRHSMRESNEANFARMVGMRIFNFFIIGTFGSIRTILENACHQSLYKDVYSFHVITLGYVSFYEDCKYAKYVVTHPNILSTYFSAGLTNEFHFDIAKLGIRIVKMIGSYKNFTECPTEVIDYMSRPDGAGVTDLYSLLKTALIQEKDLMVKYELNRVRNVPILSMIFTGVQVHDHHLKSEVVGSWTSANGGAFIDAEGLKKYASKIVYRIAVAVQEPFLQPDEKSVYNYSGICVDIMHEISIKLGFTFNLYRPETGTYRGDFEEVLQEVKVGSAHIGIGSLSVTSERRKENGLVAFTIPYYDAIGTQIMMKMPEASKSIFKIIEVIHIGVWICVGVVFFFTSAMLWIFDRWSPYSYRNTLETLDDSEEGRIFTAKEALWFCLTSITSLGGGDSPRSLSGRILTGSWWLFGYMIIVSYSANLAAFLTASHLELSIESLDDLYNQQKVKYGMVNNSRAKKFFDFVASREAETFEIWLENVMDYNDTYVNQPFYSLDYPVENKFTKMVNIMSSSKLVLPSFEDAVKKVQASTSSDKFAFIGDSTDIRFSVLTNCDLQSVGDEFDKKFYAFAIPNGSHLKDPFDKVIIQLMNDRVLEKIKNKWWRENPKAIHCSDDKYQADGITIQNIVGVFLLIGGGIVIAMIINWIDKMMMKRRGVKLEVHPFSTNEEAHN